MTTQSESDHRRQRLRALADRFDGLAPLGRFLGFRDGAYIGQMLRGDRPITEKFVARVEARNGMKGWFGRTSELSHQQPPTAMISKKSSEESQIHEFSGNGPQNGIAEHIYQIGSILLNVDELRRNAIAELLAGVAKHPAQAHQIAMHINALLQSEGKIAA